MKPVSEYQKRLRVMRDMLAVFVWYQESQGFTPEEAGKQILEVIDEAERTGPLKKWEEQSTTKADAICEQILDRLRGGRKAPVMIPRKKRP